MSGRSGSHPVPTRLRSSPCLTAMKRCTMHPSRATPTHTQQIERRPAPSTRQCRPPGGGDGNASAAGTVTSRWDGCLPGVYRSLKRAVAREIFQALTGTTAPCIIARPRLPTCCGTRVRAHGAMRSVTTNRWMAARSPSHGRHSMSFTVVTPGVLAWSTQDDSPPPPT